MVSSPSAAEDVTKLLENIFRSVNIALVNGLACCASGWRGSTWEVVDAAATKQYGYHAVLSWTRPGRPLHSNRSLLPGLEGQGINLAPDFIELAAERPTRTCPIM